MFIINDYKAVANIELLLTSNEARELMGALEQLLEAERNKLHHVHVSSSAYETEIAVSILDKNDIETYNKSIRDIVNNTNE